MLSSLALAESEPVKLARIEDLISHLTQYPEAKHGAVKVLTLYFVTIPYKSVLWLILV